MNLVGKYSAIVLFSSLGICILPAHAETKFDVTDASGNSIEKQLKKSFSSKGSKVAQDYLAFLASKRFKIDLGRDEEGNLRPEGSIAKYWSENFYTELSLTNARQTSSGKVDGVDNSKKATNFDQTNYKLNVLGYEHKLDGHHSVSMSFEYERIDRDSNEFGYFEYNSDLVAFDNNVELAVDRMAVAADMFLLDGENYKLELSGSYFLYNRLSVNHKIDLAGVSDQGIAKSKIKQDDAYELKLEGRYILDNGYGIGLNHTTSFTSLKYNAALINSSFDQFESTKIETEDTISQSQVRLYLGTYLGTLRPSLNYSIIKTETKNLTNNTSIDDNYNVISIGLNGKF